MCGARGRAGWRPISTRRCCATATCIWRKAGSIPWRATTGLRTTDLLGRRIRRNYLWILIIQTVAYLGKLAVHPTAITSFDELYARATVGPVPGQLMLAAGVVYISVWCGIAVISYRADRARHGRRVDSSAMG